MIQIADVPLGHIIHVWPHVREHIARALDRDETRKYELGDVLDILLQDKAQLWVAWNTETNTADAAAVTEVIQYPRLRELYVWIIGGKPGTLRSWVYDLRNTLEQYALARGCAYLSGAMRRGWIKMGGDGWKQTGVTMAKRLVKDNGQ